MSSSNHPKYGPGFFLLIVVFLVSFSLQTSIQWLEKSISYGNLHLSFTSEALDLSADIMHTDGKLYIAIPERGYSVIFSNREIKRLIKKYSLLIKVTTLNILGSITFLILVFVVVFIVRNRRSLWRNFKRSLSALLGYFHFILTSFFFFILMLLSFFPLSAFLGWWQKFPFIKNYPTPGSIEHAIHDFMTMFLILPRHRLFYASLLTLPSFLLQLTVWISFSALILFWIPVPKTISRWSERLLEKAGEINPKTMLLAGAVFIFALANLKSFYSYHHLPASVEGIVQSFQAKMFQTGKISYPLPISKEFFSFPYLSDEIRWFSQFSPGWPAFLALGYRLRIPWLLNPLFTIGFYFLFYLFSREVYGEKNARLAALLIVVSPALIETAAGFGQYGALVFFLWGFLYYAKRMENAKTFHSFLTAGIFLGTAININPKITLSFSIPFVIYLTVFSAKRKSWTSRGIFLGTTILVSTPILIYNYFLTGKFLVFGTNHLFAASLSAQTKPFLDSFIFTLSRLDEINRSLFYWPIPALTFFFIFIILLRTDKHSWDYLLILGLGGSFLTHILFIDSHPAASNFLLPMIPVFVLFSSRSILLLPQWFSKLNLAPQRTRTLLGIILLLMILSGVKHFFSFPEKIPDLAARLRHKGIKTALVFMDKKWDNYRIGFGLNHPDLKNSDYVVARDLGNYNRKLIHEFSDRPAYRFQPYEEIEFLPLKPE